MTATQSAPASLATARRASGYIPTLDGWRAIAILGVMFAHSTQMMFEKAGSHESPRMLQFARFGTLGVNLFFGISGFLICSRLLDEETKYGKVSLKKFYIRRVCRILPPYLAFLLVIGVLAIAGEILVSSGEWFSSLTFWRNYYPGTAHGWYTGHFWSLAVEEHFYLLWPVTLVLAGRKQSLWIAIATALSIAIWRPYEFRHRLMPFPFYRRTDIVLDGLLWGCVLAIICARPTAMRRMSMLLNPLVWIVVVAAFIAVSVYEPPFKMTYQSILIVLILAGTVLHPSSHAGRILEWPSLRWIGRMSYSLYIWQQLFLLGGPGLESKHFAMLQRLPFNMIAVFVLSAASFYLLEKPFVALGHRLARPATPGHRDLPR